MTDRTEVADQPDASAPSMSSGSAAGSWRPVLQNSLSWVGCRSSGTDTVDAIDVPEVARGTPARSADERALLDGWLEYYRATVHHKCTGLSPDQLVERSCPPSTASLIGLVRHLTEMERVYAHRLAEPDLPLRYVTDISPDADFDDATPAAADTDLKTFAAHCTQSRQVMAALPLDGNLRWTYLYLIKEYSRHLGHADLLRERIDGTTGE